MSRRKVKLDAAAGSMQLIWGDEVETVGAAGGGDVMVRCRGREGTVPVDALDGEPRLECYFLDVGQGDATLIVTRGGRKILIDGGKGVAAGRTGEAEQALIWKYRLDEVDEPVVIDLVVLTHADEDHIGGLINLIKNPKIVVKRVVHSGVATYRHPERDRQLGATTTRAGIAYLVSHHDTLDDLDRDGLSDDFAAWVAVLELEGVDYHSVRAGDTLDVGDPALVSRSSAQSSNSSPTPIGSLCAGWVTRRTRSTGTPWSCAWPTGTWRSCSLVTSTSRAPITSWPMSARRAWTRTSSRPRTTAATSSPPSSKLLPGIINVRSDGQHILAATRVLTGYWWVIYGPEQPAPRTNPTL